MSKYPEIVSYPESVRSFRAVARAVEGWRLHSYPHPETLPPWSNLSTDVAVFGPKDASRALVITSGSEGNNLFVGAHVQKQIMQVMSGQADNDAPKIVLVHALDPFGVATYGRKNVTDISPSWKMATWKRLVARHVDPMANKKIVHIDFVLGSEKDANRMEKFWPATLAKNASVLMRQVHIVPDIFGVKTPTTENNIAFSFDPNKPFSDTLRHILVGKPTSPNERESIHVSSSPRKALTL